VSSTTAKWVSSMPAEAPIANRDGAVSAWLGAQTAAGQFAALVYEQVGSGSLYARVDAIEREAWRQFLGRMRELAGELAR
jgi:hypothetical protein